MYRIDRASNRITRLKPMRFGDLQFTERQHLQEWIANQPDALGEELLIIQKEFDGFDDTKERLDLLALDKAGHLVIIENKLDDSGKDVVWQAIKYASYCSTLSKTQVAEIFQLYLNKSAPGQDARALICEFLAQEDFDEVVLNQGNEQRLILVAAQFRKEVTSTVLWLLKHRVFIKCFRATPFHDGDSHFLTLEQVIPLPEAEELMIGIAQKETEELSAERGQATRHHLRNEFWHAALDALRSAGVTAYANVSPGRDHWLNAGSGLSGVFYTMVFNRDEVRVDLGLGTASQDVNKAAFDHLFAQRERLDAEFGEPLDWRRMDDKKASLIECSAAFDAHNRKNWPEVIDWLVDHVQRMVRVFEKEVPALRAVVKGRLPREAKA
ncbi:MAG: hypothetical protein RLZZ618_108 [Pseudomonadota bacterium]|jgi:hypothetical protein